MTVDDLRSLFDLQKDAHIAKKLGVSKVAVGDWAKNGIPKPRQAIIQIQTNGALKADGIEVFPEFAEG